MSGPPVGARQALRLVVALMAVAAATACRDRASRVVTAGFTFEPVSFSSALLGGALTASQLSAVERVARAELDRAFTGLRVRVANRHDTRYHVAVRQEVRDARARGTRFVAGESRAVRGFGGRGAVNFSLLASTALSCASANASEDELVAAIGRGVGRSAAHELAHQFLPTSPLHATRDRASYEYEAAGRCEQYFGPMHWDLAAPLLRERLGVVPPFAGPPAVDTP